MTEVCLRHACLVVRVVELDSLFLIHTLVYHSIR